MLAGMLPWWRKLLYSLAKGVMWAGAKLMFRLRAEGIKHIPLQGSLLIASNHVSHLDPPLVGLTVPRYVFHMAKRELFRVPWLLASMRILGTIMVDRGRGQQALIDAREYLNHGECIVIFPEGTRSKDGILGRGRTGAIVLAIQSGCPVLPCAIIGSEQAMSKGSHRMKLLPVVVRFGEPYVIEYEGDREQVPREVLQREVYRLMERIEALLPAKMHPTLAAKRKWYGALLDEQP